MMPSFTPLSPILPKVLTTPSAEEVGNRIRWSIQRQSLTNYQVSQAINLGLTEFESKLRGEYGFTSLEIARICEKTNLRTDALFQPTWEKFLQRQFDPGSELDQLVDLLKDLKLTPKSNGPVDILTSVINAFNNGGIGIRVLIRAVNLLGTMIICDDV